MRPAPSHQARRPRLLFLVRQLALGGGERTILALAQHLREDFEVTVGYFSGSDALRGELERLGVPVVEISGSTGLARSAARLRRALPRLAPDVVNTHDPYCAVLARLVRPLGGPPVVETLQLVTSAYRPQVAFADRLTSGLLGRGTISVSREVERAWLDTRLRPLLLRGPRRTVIPNPLPSGRVDAARTIDRDAKRRELGLRPDEIVLSNVGRFVAQKNQAALIDAVSVLRLRRVGVALVLVGYGELENALRERAEARGVADRVHFAVHRHDAPEIVAASDLFVFPSVREGLPVAPLEAMALGVPVVASDVPPMTEVVTHGETGFLTRPDDPEKIADAVERALRDPELRHGVARRAEHEVTRRFSSRHVGERYAEFLLGAAGLASATGAGRPGDSRSATGAAR